MKPEDIEKLVEILAPLEYYQEGYLKLLLEGQIYLNSGWTTKSD